MSDILTEDGIVILSLKHGRVRNLQFDPKIVEKEAGLKYEGWVQFMKGFWNGSGFLLR